MKITLDASEAVKNITENFQEVLAKGGFPESASEWACEFWLRDTEVLLKESYDTIEKFGDFEEEELSLAKTLGFFLRILVDYEVLKLYIKLRENNPMISDN